MKIIPAIDIIDGKCVRLSQGDYSQKKIYNENPVEVAQSFEDAGIQHLHLVDLDGAKAGKIINWKVLNSISSKTNLKIDFGGGLKSNDDLKIAFENGATQITGGSIAVKNKTLFLEWLKQYGAEKIILGADTKNNKIAISGWLDESQEELFSFLNLYIHNGISHCICTDISKDGMLQGPNINLYREILKQHPSLKLIASGGVSSFDDLIQLKENGLYGVIVGKAIYEGKIALKEIQKL